MIAFADIALRGAAVACLVLLALRFALVRPFGQKPAIACALSVLMGVYVLASAPALAPFPYGMALAANPALLWLTGLSIFDDGFRLRPLHAVVAAATIAPAVFETLSDVRAIAVAGLYLHLAWVAWTTAKGDLVEARIAFRRAFFIFVALTGLAVTYVEATQVGQPPEWLALVQAGSLAFLSGAFLHWSHRLGPDLWPTTPQDAPRKPPPDDPLAARLEAAMAEEVWRIEGLTIGALAGRLETPEHRLRKLINQRLGHRNFASFVNAARVDAAATALADPKRREEQVLTIAHESGFASLGPFNRAFRARKGVSPTEWREAAGRK